MNSYKVDFASLPWQATAPGARVKVCRNETRQIRLLEFTSDFYDFQWCEQGHIGLVLTGTLEIEFKGQLISYPQGSGIFIPPGAAHAHKARAATSVVRLVFVEDIDLAPRSSNE